MGKEGHNSWAQLTFTFIHSLKKQLKALLINIIFYMKKNSLLKKMGRKILVRYPTFTLLYAQALTHPHAEQKQLAIAYNDALKQMIATHNNTLKQIPPPTNSRALKQMTALHTRTLEQMVATYKTESLKLILQQLTPRTEAIYYLFDMLPKRDD